MRSTELSLQKAGPRLGILFLWAPVRGESHWQARSRLYSNVCPVQRWREWKTSLHRPIQPSSLISWHTQSPQGSAGPYLRGRQPDLAAVQDRRPVPAGGNKIKICALNYSTPFIRITNRLKIRGILSKDLLMGAILRWVTSVLLGG